MDWKVLILYHIFSTALSMFTHLVKLSPKIIVVIQCGWSNLPYTDEQYTLRRFAHNSTVYIFLYVH